MRLVDASIPFKVVYALYHHEYLGYLISSHIVQVLPDGQLSLIHQGIYPDNMEQFASELDDKDRKLICLTAELSSREVMKKFGGDNRNHVEFFTKKFEGELKKHVLTYIQKRMSKILPLLEDRDVYEMGKDGYAAHTPIKVLDEVATVLFHFRRNENSTRYFPTIKLKGQKIDFQYRNATLICHEPAWMLLNGELFTFKDQVDGKKLLPFLNKRYISIPKEKEAEYYQKFISQIVSKYDVYAKGFDIKSIYEHPTFSLLVKQHSEEYFSFICQVHYGRFIFPIKKKAKVKVQLESQNDSYIFYRIVRKLEEEKGITSYLEEIQPQNNLSPWENIPREIALNWLVTYKNQLAQKGIEVIQDQSGCQINFNQPEIILEAEESGDWFDIKAQVKIGSYLIPFIKLRSYILKTKREYPLPDGTIAILPDHWFSDYRHLLEVSQKKDTDTLRIKKYHAPLLQFPSTNSQSNLWEQLKEFDKIPEVDPPKNLQATLRNYQAQGFNWLCFIQSHHLGGILADDMGLGKTLQTLTLLLREKEKGINIPSLVILPTSLIQNWYNESQKFTPDLDILIYTGVAREKTLETFSNYDVIFTTYGIARQDIDFLKDYPFHYVILDESQMIKNPDSKTTKAIKKLISYHRLSLTGTPIENTIMDIWSQMSFLNPGLLGNETFFKKFYVSPIEKEQNEERSEKLRKIIYPFILRRKKEQVEKELPPKIEKLQYCEMTEAQRELYEKTRNSYRNYLLELISSGTWKRNKLNILTGLQQLRQIAIHPRMVEESFALNQSGKYKEVKRLLNNVIHKNAKILIFSQFVKMLSILKQDLEKEGIRFNYLDGNTRDRQGQVDSFQQDEDIRVFLISLKAGGVGLNLTAADYVFILDPWWNPAVENQAVDRSHRIGQKNTVFYYKFITQHSIEEKILSLQQRKIKLSDDIISVEADIYKSLNAEDLGELLNM